VVLLLHGHSCRGQGILIPLSTLPLCGCCIQRVCASVYEQGCAECARIVAASAAFLRTAEEQRTQSCTRCSLVVLLLHGHSCRGQGIRIPLRSLPLCGCCIQRVGARSVAAGVAYQGPQRSRVVGDAPWWYCSYMGFAVAARSFCIPLRTLPLCGCCIQRVSAHVVLPQAWLIQGPQRSRGRRVAGGAPWWYCSFLRIPVAAQAFVFLCALCLSAVAVFSA